MFRRMQGQIDMANVRASSSNIPASTYLVVALSFIGRAIKPTHSDERENR